MYSKFIQTTLGVICSLLLVACSQSNSNRVNKASNSNKTNVINRTKVAFDGDDITIFDKSKQSASLQIKIGDEISYTEDVEVNQKTSVLSLLKANQDLYNDIALSLAQNNGDVKLNLRITGVLDTTIVYHLDITETSQYTTKAIQGKCANLIGNFDASNVESDIIKWLYRNGKKNVGDETINNMRLYLKELSRTSFDEYSTNEAIPVIKSLKGQNYKVSSNLVADNYYLLACNTEDDIDNFIEDMISKKFDGAVHSLNQSVRCYRKTSSSGILCIFLVGIDNDWNHKISPVGLVCVDDLEPLLSPFYFNSKTDDIIFDKNKVKIIIPNEIPIFTGYASLGTREWGGNGLSCNVNFIVHFGGDVKTLTLVRKGNLAKWIGAGKKVIDLQTETSPYIFSYELHLEDGDNYVPIIVTDLIGNKIESKFNVGCEMTPNDNPQINIDNNINLF